jgi:hypothetical protein
MENPCESPGGRMINPSVKFFPCVMIALSVSAAAVYGNHGDIRHTIYWIAAAVLTASVTF